MTLLYVLLGAFIVGAVAFGVAVLVTGSDPGLASDEPDGSSVPLPADRPLAEQDFQAVRFDTGLRGYRMSQVDSALRRAAYDVGYKEELVAVLEAEVSALRAGRVDEADALQSARLAALGEPAAEGTADAIVDDADDDADDVAPADEDDTVAEDSETEPSAVGERS
jgi:DivIVA domain-containing protein